MEKILPIFLELFNYILVFFLIALVLAFSFSILTKKFDFSSKKIKIYSIFMNLTTRQIIAFSCIIIKYTFILYTIFNCKNIGYIQLIFLLLSTIIYIVCIKGYKKLLLEIINSLIVFSGFYAIDLIIQYMKEFRYLWYLILIIVLTDIFIIAYSSYFLLKEIDGVTSFNIKPKGELNGPNQEK